jgi:hypothetical protein
MGNSNLFAMYTNTHHTHQTLAILAKCCKDVFELWQVSLVFNKMLGEYFESGKSQKNFLANGSKN